MYYTAFGCSRKCLDYVNYQDLKADDLGVWVPTGTKKVFFRFSSSGILKFTNKKSGNAVKSSYYTLTRRYNPMTSTTDKLPILKVIRT